jgi:hypothetical protein
VDWETAHSAASSSSYFGLGGHLATATSQWENDFLASINQVGQLWLGGYQPQGQNTKEGWTWVNGEGSFPGENGHPTFANWAVDEANDAGMDERYLTIGRYLSTAPAAWNDEGHLEMIHGYIVEYEGVPETQAVPDAGGTFTLLGLGLGTLAFYRKRRA